MYEIVVESSFCATHALRLADGSTESVHGHDWRVTAVLAAPELDECGFVADFEDVGAALGEITQALHHADLNNHPWFLEVNPTAERVARVVFDRLGGKTSWGSAVASVSVTEAPGCMARYLRH